ncbi:RBBP9/YdeN family alpha/beta hydrolase [Kitasatospora sp. NPDC050543]|uniref:RBBP9/YdeN family alpha/beta hydrolase n=1 Tax=Kitasatospora sp. NPDC050543 TaxID=3364054 RepID=UPI0037B0D884
MTEQQPSYLLVPGYQNSGPEHWQSHWEREDPAFRRLEQADWDRPDQEDWVARLDEAVRAHRGPLVLVAHSLGCATVARWAARTPAGAAGQVVGALLVAPADIDHAEVPELIAFRPVALEPLPFPSTVVASSNDPWVTLDRARLFAGSWGSRFVELGAYGHLNSYSGLGSWPRGRELLAELLPEPTPAG